MEEEAELVARVTALDVGKASLVACVRVPHEDKPGAALAGGPYVRHHDPAAAGAAVPESSGSLATGGRALRVNTASTDRHARRQEARLAAVDFDSLAQVPSDLGYDETGW